MPNLMAHTKTNVYCATVDIHDDATLWRAVLLPNCIRHRCTLTLAPKKQACACFMRYFFFRKAGNAFVSFVTYSTSRPLITFHLVLDTTPPTTTTISPKLSFYQAYGKVVLILAFPLYRQIKKHSVIYTFKAMPVNTIHVVAAVYVLK